MDVQKYSGNFTGKAAVSVLLTLAAALALWLFIAAHHRRAAVEEIGKSLVTINSYKAADIAGWIEDHNREALRLSRNPFLGGLVAAETAHPGSNRAPLIAWLKDHAELKQYSSMVFLSPKGAVITATPGYLPETAREFTAAFARAAGTGKPVLTDLYLSGGGRPQLSMLSPISAGYKSGPLVSVLAINIDPEKELYPLLQAHPPFFQSVENLLARVEGENLLTLNQLKYRPGSALKLTRPVSDKGLPGIRFVKDIPPNFFDAGTDYRGVKIFRAASRVADTGWVIATNLDRDVILAPVKHSERLYLALILLAAGLLYLLVYLLLRSWKRAGLAGKLEAERRLAALFADLPGLAYRCANDRDWTMEFLSEGCLGFTGYRPEELLGNKALSFNDLIVPEDRERVWETIQAAVSRGERYELAYSIKCRDGGVKHVFEQGRAVKRPDGSVEALEGFLGDVTPLRKAETGLRESELVFREFLEHSPIYVFFKDENVRATHLSRNYETLLGKPLKDLLGRNMDELFPSDLAKSMVADDLRILKEGREVTAEEELNGRSYRTIKFPISQPGRPSRLAGFTIDITDSKRVEEALRKSEAHLLAILESTADGILAVDDEGKVLRANRRFYELWRIPAALRESGDDEALLQFVQDQLAEPDAFLAKVRELYHSNTESLDTLAFRDGRSFERFSLPLSLKNGRTGRVWSFRDITGRKLAEQKLRESELLLRESQRQAHVGSYALDVNTGLWRSSEELDGIFGIGENYQRSVEGWLAMVHPDDRAMMSAYLTDEVIGRKQHFDKEYRIIRQDTGAWRWVHGLGGLEFDAMGRPVKMNGTIQDIHERKLAELELEKLNRDLVAKRQEMENFLFIASHDLRTPLVNIQGFAQNLENYLRELVEQLSPARLAREVNEGVSKLIAHEIPGALKFVLESSRKMDSLINSLVKVARLGRVEMKPRDLNMNDTLKKVVDSTSYQLKEAGAAANIGVLPPCKADPAAVSQIFTNLLDNAIKYRAADRTLSVTITGETRDARVLYKVADNGSGIAGEDLGRIWDIFYRGKGAGEGEGIGLTVVKYMAEKNGGSIRAESEEGRGTVFYLELPAAGGTK